MKKILVTGGAGFIGANFVKYMVDLVIVCFFMNIKKVFNEKIEIGG